MAISDFNLSVDNIHLEAFKQAYDFSSLIKKLTCYQSNTPSCIDLTLTNWTSLFKLSNTFETGLSDHHKLDCTILKSEGFKGAPIEKIYKSYKTINVNNFKNTLKFELEKIKSERYDELEAAFLKELNKHAPLKRYKVASGGAQTCPTANNQALVCVLRFYFLCRHRWC